MPGLITIKIPSELLKDGVSITLERPQVDTDAESKIGFIVEEQDE